MSGKRAISIEEDDLIDMYLCITRVKLHKQGKCFLDQDWILKHWPGYGE